MNDKLFVPKRDYVGIEVFVGPVQQIKEPGAQGELLGSGYQVFVNYARVGTVLRKDFVNAIQDTQPSVAEGVTLSKEFFQEFGRQLFDLLFKEELEEVYRDRLRLARDSGRVLRLALCFDDPALDTAPWEYLWDPEEELFLAASTGIAFSRRTPTTRNG